MNAERLLQHFDRISEAPAAVARLRRFILDLAVRGKLVAQDPADEPAAELLKRIQAEKNQLTQRCKGAKKGEGEENLGDLESLEKMPFALPGNWTWSKLAAITTKTGSGSTPRGGQTAYQASGIPFLRSQNVHDDGLRLTNVAYIDDITHTRMNGTAVESGDLLLNITGGSIGRCCRIPDITTQANISQHVAIIRLAVAGMRDFVHKVVISPFFQSFIIDEQTGAGRGGLPKNRMDQIPIPLPPLAEQHRIVAKVDELMALCDQLQTARNEREAKRDRLVAASLHRLGTAGPESFPAAARFHLGHLPRLTTRPEHIKHLRQTILNLAVRGHLVPQDPNDEPAAELLKRIQAGKARLMKEGLIPRSKASAAGKKLTFELPTNWRPIRLDDVSNLVTSGSRGWADYYADDGPKFVRAQNIRFGYLRLNNLACVQPQANSECKRPQVSAGDLLLVITGAGVTNPALMDRDLGEAYVSQHVALIKPTITALSQWLLLCLMSGPGGRDELVECAYGAGKPGLNLDNIRTLSAPLPPLAEQHRIVAKVDELMAICDQLETQLTTTDSDNRGLLEAVLSDALAPALKDVA